MTSIYEVTQAETIRVIENQNIIIKATLYKPINYDGLIAYYDAMIFMI